MVNNSFRCRRPLFRKSLVASRDDEVPVPGAGRTSSTAFIPFEDRVSTCIQQRAAGFQGFLSQKKIEMLQVVQYEQHQEYRPHCDWFHSTEFKAQRISTIFGFIEGDCENCGTQFPELSVDWSKEDPQWCKFVECDNLSALTFKPVPGSAVFWKNIHKDGKGDERTLHAGLPVIKGRKLGLNIWTIV